LCLDCDGEKHSEQQKQGCRQPRSEGDLANPVESQGDGFRTANQIRFEHRALHFIAVGSCFQSESSLAAFLWEVVLWEETGFLTS
jgi:hypothetical protein